MQNFFLYAYKIKTVMKQKLLMHMLILVQEFHRSVSTRTQGDDYETINLVNDISLTSGQTE